MEPTTNSDKRDNSPSIDPDGKVLRTSVSALKTLDDCKRKYSFQYRVRLPRKPDGKGVIRGKLGHKRLENYLNAVPGAFAALDPLERAGLAAGHVPEPGPGILVELAFNALGFTPLTLGEGPEAVQMAGFIDLVNSRPNAPKVIRAVDWKFKKSISKYGATSEQLVDPAHEAGIQMMGYGEFLRRNAARFPAFEGIGVSHVTFQTEGAKRVEEVGAALTLTGVKSKWETVSSRLLDTLKATAREADPFKVRGVEDQYSRDSICNKYGGCDFRDTCHSRMSRIVAGFKTAGTGANVGILGAIGSAPNGIPQPMAAVAPRGGYPPKAPRLVIEDQTVKVPAPAIQIPAARVDLTPETAIQGVRYIVSGQTAEFVCMADIGGTRFGSFKVDGNPVPLLVPATTVIKEAAPPPTEVKPVLQVDAPPIQIPPAVAVATTVAVDIAEAPEKTRARRRTKAEMEAARAAENPGAQGPVEATPAIGIAATAVDAPAAVAPPPIAPVVAAAGIYLYFGCTPMGVPTASLVPYVEALDVKLRDATKAGGFDIRMIEDRNHPFAFGKWKPYLAGAAREIAPPPGHYVVTYGDERVECAADSLAATLPPGHVVRGGGR